MSNMEILEIYFSSDGYYSSNNDDLCKKINLNLIKKFLFDDDMTHVKVYTENDKIKDSINFPSVIYSYAECPDDKLILYTQNEQLNDENRPSLCFTQNKNQYIEIWYLNDERARKNNLPCEIRYIDGYVVDMLWFSGNGIAHREDGPAIITYFKNGMIHQEEYYINGIKHRVYGPAEIHYGYNSKYKDGIGFWYVNDTEYTSQVNKWLKENNMNWQYMCEDDYNRMWMEIL